MKVYILLAMALLGVTRPDVLLKNERYAGMIFMNRVATDGDCMDVPVPRFESFGESLVNDFRRTMIRHSKQVFEATICSPTLLDEAGNPLILNVLSSNARQLKALLTPGSIERLLKSSRTAFQGKVVSDETDLKVIWSDGRSSVRLGELVKLSHSSANDFWKMCGYSFRGLVLPNSVYQVDRSGGSTRHSFVVSPGNSGNFKPIIDAICGA